MQLQNVDLNLLVAMDALLEEASVTRAAMRVGLSTPAMSHALARIREQLGDPLLVRAGKSMVLSERALLLRPRVRALIAELQSVLSSAREFSPEEMDREFRIHATDHVVTVLGPALDARVREQAPKASIRFLPSGDDSIALREASIDMAIGVYSDLAPEMKRRRLFQDRLVCVVRKEHPQVKKRLSLEQYAALFHVQVAPRGRPGGQLDRMLEERGVKRRVARAVPYFLAALLLVSETDYVLTISERIARALGERMGLRVLPLPVPMEPYTLSLIWHPRADGDPAQAWMRAVLVECAQKLG